MVARTDGLTGFQAWFLDACPDALTAEVERIGDSACVRISSERHPNHATLVVAATDEATRAVFDTLPTLAPDLVTLDVVCDGRTWTMGPAPLLVPSIEGSQESPSPLVRLATTRSALYPEELPYPLPLLAQDVKADGGTLSLRLWLCLRWDASTLSQVRTRKAGTAQRTWLDVVAAHPQVTRILRVRAIDLTGNVTLDASTTFPARSWAEALWGVR